MNSITRSLLAAAFMAFPTMLCAQSREDMYNNAKKAEAAADKKLNAAYNSLIQSIRKEQDQQIADFLVKRLQKSQRAWLQFRNAQIDFVSKYQYLGYSYIRAAKIASYKTELTASRTKELAHVPDPN